MKVFKGIWITIWVGLFILGYVTIINHVDAALYPGEKNLAGGYGYSFNWWNGDQFTLTSSVNDETVNIEVASDKQFVFKLDGKSYDGTEYAGKFVLSVPLTVSAEKTITGSFFGDQGSYSIGVSDSSVFNYKAGSATISSGHTADLLLTAVCLLLASVMIAAVL